MAQSRDTQRKHDLNLITVGLESYYNNLSSQTGTFYRYPDPGADLQSDSTEGAKWIPGLVEGGHLKNIPKDPKQASIIRGNLAAVFGRFLPNAVPKAYASSTLSLGIFVNTGTLGFEPNLDPDKYNLSFSAGYILRHQWSLMEPADDAFDWNYLDGALTELKNAGKKGSIRLTAGPYSPDWLRTQQNVPTICWEQSSGVQGASWNCFPWLFDPVYQAERKEALQAMYNHYTVERPDLGQAVAFITLPIPAHIRSAEAAYVRNENWQVKLDLASGGVPIGIYCNTDFPTCPLTEIEALPAGGTFGNPNFTSKGYTDARMNQLYSNSMIDAYNAVPTWPIGIMHGHESVSPLALVQNNYNTIKNNNLVDRFMMGFTWLDEFDSLPTAEQNAYNDLKLNFYEATGANGKFGWQPNVSTGNTLLDAWCQLAAPLQSRWLEVGGSAKWVPGSDLETIFQNPSCQVAASPSPTPTPTPSPPSTADFKYLYTVGDASLQTYTLWAILENTDDPEIYSKSSAKCKKTPPANTSYNYCVAN